MEKNTLLGSLPIYAQHLSEQTGVQVIVGGQEAYTNGEKVVVPFTETNPVLSFGYIAHECAHVRNTEMQCFGETASNPFRQSVLNILEDIRIERLSMDQYPGTQEDLDYLAQSVLGGVIDPKSVTQQEPLHVVLNTLLLAGRWQVLNQSLAQPAQSMLQAQEQLLGKLLSDQIMAKVQTILACKDTWEVLNLADEIIALLPSQEDQTQSEPSGDEDSDDSDESEGDADTEGQDESEGSERGTSGDGSSSDSEDASSQTDQGEDKGQPDSEPKESSGDQGGGQSQPNNSAGDSKTTNQAQNLREQAMQATEQDLEGLISDVGDAAAQLLSEKAKRDPNVKRHLPLGGRSKHRTDQASTFRVRMGLEQSSGLRQCLNGLLQSQVVSRVRLKRQGKRMDTSRIALLKAGETRVFRSKARVERTSAAIQFLLDKSGSMGVKNSTLTPLDQAEAALYAVLHALEYLPLVSTGAVSFPDCAEEQTFSVQCSLIKRHCEPLRQAVHHGGFGAGSYGLTPLGEALWPAAVELLGANKERSILFVITDGAPDDLEYAVDMIQRCEATGIEVIGLGFGGATASQLKLIFRRFCAVGEVSNLRQALFGLVREVLVA